MVSAVLRLRRGESGAGYTCGSSGSVPYVHVLWVLTFVHITSALSQAIRSSAAAPISMQTSKF